ncbi:MAG: hypothetical protein FD149_2104 [Rhodospirillaceae bacterium]|nr:MAG: hypothetical protein FD149_2104 [Rhodospirillaceae bacterium]
MTTPALEVVAPAGTLAALRAAVEAGADAVYCGFRDATNARNFPGLNFSRDDLREGIAFAHGRGVRVFLAINTFPAATAPALWRQAVDDAARLGVDALILADIGLLDYASTRHPDVRRHLSVQASAATAEAITYYAEAFGVRRVVLPRVLAIPEITILTNAVTVETEVFAYGGLCVMAEGRCHLSSYVTGQSPNTHSVCSPASHVRYEQRAGRLVSRLGAFTINTFAPEESAGYPTLCKGRFKTRDRTGYLFEEPVSLNVIDLLPALKAAGVRAIKIEGRQRVGGPMWPRSRQPSATPWMPRPQGTPAGRTRWRT